MRYFKKIYIYILFSVYLVLGLFIFDDYGVPCDESVQSLSALINFVYVNEVFDYKIIPKNKVDNLIAKSQKSEQVVQLKDYRDRYYGVINEFILLAPTFAFKLYHNTQLLYLTRHLMTFLVFWVSSIYFYLILMYLYKNRILAVLGVTALILSPRIFADSFYNSKDLMLLSFMIIGVYYSIKYLDVRNIKFAILAGLFSGLAVDIRIVALILPVSTISIYLIQLIAIREKKISYFKPIYVFVITTFVCIYIFMPYLWEAPIERFIESWSVMSKYSHTPNMLYMGDIVNSAKLPWHYSLVWFVITTPVLYIVFIVFGIMVFLSKVLKSFSTAIYSDVVIRSNLLFFCIGAGSLIAVIVFNSTLYNGWRQLYYVYPNLLLLGIFGAYYFYKKFESINFKYIFLSLVLLYFSFVTLKMINIHPFQMIYFNEIANHYADGNFEKDYWGLSQRDGLEWLLKNYPEQPIRIYTEPFTSIFVSSRILNYSDKSKLVLSNDFNSNEFLLTNEILHLCNTKNLMNYYNLGQNQLIYEKKVNGLSILKIYKLEEHNQIRENPDYDLIFDLNKIKYYEKL